MIILDNGSLRVEIAERGAEIRRVTFGGKERFWNGDPSFWTGVAPVLFPICGGLRDDKFTIDGHEYSLIKHGFARGMDFTVESFSKTNATFLLRETEETLKAYPWCFELRVKYSLVGNAIRVDYDVKNTSTTTMYTAIGGHEAYLCENGVEDYDVIFEREETLNALGLNGTLCTRNATTVLKDSKVLPLYNKYFDIDALILPDVKSRFVTLKNRKTGEAVSVNFEGFNYLLLWTKPGAPYLCIEPWTTLPSFEDDGYDITLKEGMTAVGPQETFKKTHTIYF